MHSWKATIVLTRTLPRKVDPSNQRGIGGAPYLPILRASIWPTCSAFLVLVYFQFSLFFCSFFPFCSVFFFFSSSLLCLCLVNTTLVVVQPQPSLAFFSASFAQLFSNFAAAGASCWHLMSLYRQFKILREPIFCGSSFRREDKKRNVRNMERKSRHGR